MRNSYGTSAAGVRRFVRHLDLAARQYPDGVRVPESDALVTGPLNADEGRIRAIAAAAGNLG